MALAASPFSASSRAMSSLSDRSSRSSSASRRATVSRRARARRQLVRQLMALARAAPASALRFAVSASFARSCAACASAIAW